ncbi:type II toxin-antitoxin system VapB family antitoxin [Sphingomonas radiodurans]|uniref:type II toxin-antitoxin system VapB family antitoxin n=1 Tax=Sphingomonas radiodurans TaxID=2890321 RepID=UPI001E64ED7B|nr:type II toxin-antitoxin system VapB family antitoxin [Sphingomonas radiodurans]WBH15917.1 type II toxin-antitoxin system VapB family antitoxin [Sphingomonas radiodurans]
MGVQLNIKDPETVRLARELAGKTGKTVTETIRTALEREWAEREKLLEEKRLRIEDAIANFRRHMPEEWKTMTSKEVMDSIYNEDGSFAR